MKITFDPSKDATNQQKHKLSLADFPGFDDNPEWTDQTTEQATLASEVHGPDVMSVLVKRGRPTGSNKERIAIRVDHDALAKFRALGPGWQTRINEVLVKAAEGL